MRKNCRKFNKIENWEKYEKRLIGLYQDILKKERNAHSKLTEFNNSMLRLKAFQCDHKHKLAT